MAQVAPVYAPIDRSAFESAVDSFKRDAGLSTTELRELEVTSLGDLWRTIGRIQQEQRNTRKMVHLKRIRPFLDVMEDYGKVLDTFVNASPIMAFIWGPMKYLLMVTSKFTDAFDSLLEGYLQIGENIPLLLQYQQVFKDNQYMQTVLVGIFEDILEFHRDAVRYFKQGTWKQLFHATWRNIHRKVTHLSKNLQQQKELLQGQATIKQFEKIQTLRKKEKERFDKLMRDEHARRHISVQQWLCAMDSEFRQEDALKRRYPGTCDWLLHDNRFQQWFSLDHCTDPLLWLNGIPGAGKTVLASHIIQEARNLPMASRTVAFFYCKSTDEHRSGFVNVARGLLSQLLVQNDDLLHHLYEKAYRSGEVVLASENLAKELLELALKSRPKTYIIIDGLDEYSREDRKEICHWFQSMIKDLPPSELGTIRCLFISQDDGCAKKDFFTVSQIKITAKDNKKDIEAFCKHWHQRIEAKFGKLEKREHDITNVVTARAQGMFLFAKLVTWNLSEQMTRQDLEAELEPDSFPTGLDEAYARITDRLFGPTSKVQSRSKNALKLLGWLSCAKRPLKWYEIQGAMAIDAVEGIFNPSQKFQEDCKDICASLVEIGSDESVTLVHSTVKGYLRKRGYICPSKVECDLATLCLTYLSLREFEFKEDEVIEVDGTKEVREATVDAPTEGPKAPSDPTEMGPGRLIKTALFQGHYSFADYAVCFWALHLEEAISKHSEQDPEEYSALNECLTTFVEVQSSDSAKPVVVSTTLQKRLQALQSHPYYSTASQAIASSKNLLGVKGKEPTKDEVLLVCQANVRIRAVLEYIVSYKTLEERNKPLEEKLKVKNLDKTTKASIENEKKLLRQRHDEDRVAIAKFHGRYYFKCPRLNCQFFHIGFPTELQRKQHVFKHDRSFKCSVKGCPQSVIGCATAKDLKKHVFEYHGITAAEEELEFQDDDVQKEDGGNGLRKKQNSLECPFEHCNAKFTRPHNLRAHVRSHNNERPYICSFPDCEKSFVRHHDRKRHEQHCH